ncbi:MAG: HIT domain-containing protein [Anaerolineales bacterium]|jgi:ATP adenylyltransferase
MKHLWSPWRMQYIENHPARTGCIFCQALASSDDAASLLLHRAQHAFVLLNRFPYTSGHLMVVPNLHAATLEDVPLEALAQVMALTQTALKALRRVYAPQGFNLGVNLGESAGAGVVDHVHLHVVPRWTGDTNFMAALADTRVLPETLEETYRRLSQAWQEISPP